MAAILLLADDTPGQASTLHEHIDAFGRWSRHEVFRHNPVRCGDSRLLDLDEFDGVVIHYSLAPTNSTALPLRLREKLRRYRGLKVQYIQDDYRMVDAMCAAMRDLGINVLFCLMPEVDLIWSQTRLPGVVRRTTLAGYVPDALVGRRVPPPGARPLDVGYRARELPFWLGRLSQDKVRIGREFLARAGGLGLRCDIAWQEHERIYGEAWYRFLLSCRAVLGTESAASVVDFDGTIETRVRALLAQRPDVSFDEVEREILGPFEDQPRVAVISPRAFEAAALRAALVLFPGRYQDVLQPGRHYIELARDMSNAEDVARMIRDDALLTEITGRCYEDVVASGRYSHRQMVREFDETIEDLLGSGRPKVKVAFALARLETAAPLRGLADLAHPMRRARNAALLTLLSLLPVMRSREVLRLLGRRFLAVGQPGAPPWGRTAADLFRLALLRRWVSSGLIGLEGQWTAEDTLRLSTVRLPPVGSGPGHEPREEPRTPRRLIWAHPGFPASLPVPSGGAGLARLPFAAPGEYVFRTASWWATTAPNDWNRVVAALVS